MGFVIDENWNFEIDIDECNNSRTIHFDAEIINLRETMLKTLDNSSINIIKGQDCLAQSTNEELKLMTESNRKLQQEIDTKLKSLTHQQTKYENCKRDQKLLKKEVKETHEALLMARKHYKKCLNIYYSIESRSNGTQVVFVQFFTELKRNSDHYSVCLVRNPNTKQYTLQSTNPTLKFFNEIQRKLQEINDVPGLMCWIRDAFMLLKQNKVQKKTLL